MDVRSYGEETSTGRVQAPHLVVGAHVAWRATLVEHTTDIPPMLSPALTQVTPPRTSKSSALHRVISNSPSEVTKSSTS
jgi:hypothetical protein